MGVRQTLCERSKRATEKPENGSGRKFYILWIWDNIRSFGSFVVVLSVKNHFLLNQEVVVYYTNILTRV